METRILRTPHGRAYTLEDCSDCDGMGIEVGDTGRICSSCGGECFVKVFAPSVPSSSESVNASYIP